MNPKVAMAAVGVGMLLAAVPMSAHHSFAAVYDSAKSVTVEGTLVQFVLRNPHSFLFVDAKDADGVTQRFEVEWIAARHTNREGVNKDSLKVGDHVVVTGNPGRNPGDHRIRMTSITQTESGWKWEGAVE